MDVSHSVQAPCIIRGIGQTLKPCCLCSCVFAGFFQREGMTAQQIAAQRMVGTVGMQHPLYRAAHTTRIAQNKPDAMAGLGGQRVLGGVAQHPFQSGNRACWTVGQPTIQRVDPSRLAFGDCASVTRSMGCCACVLGHLPHL